MTRGFFKRIAILPKHYCVNHKTAGEFIVYCYKPVEEQPNEYAFLFADFLKFMFGKEEKKKFNKAMIHFAEEMREAVGYQVTQICNEQNLTELLPLRQKLQRE